MSFEYKLMSLGANWSRYEQQMNELGEDGWKAVGFSGSAVLFMRETVTVKTKTFDDRPDHLLVGLYCWDCKTVRRPDGSWMDGGWGASRCGVDYGPDTQSHLNVAPVYVDVD